MKSNLKNLLENILADETINEHELINQITNAINENRTDNRANRESQSLCELIKAKISDLKNNEKPENIINTGFDSLDQIFGGFAPGELILLGGRPSMGKTQLLINLMLNISKSSPVLFYTYDLSEHALINRFISCLTTINIGKIHLNKINEEEMETLSKLTSCIKDYKIYINDTCNSSLSSFKATCQKEIQEKGAKVIVVDYIQMMSSYKFRNNREAEISLISRELKNIAKDFNVSVIGISQLSRSVESRGGNKRPHLSDLRDSGALEQDADKVLLMYRPEYYGITQDEDGNNMAGVVEIIVAKNRNGMLGTAMLKVNSEFTNFTDLENYTEDFTFSSDRLNELDSLY